MPWSSPSRLDQSIACPASVVLPKSPDTPGPSALWGKEVHALIEGKESTPRARKWYGENYAPGTIEMYWPGGEHEVMYLERGGKVERLAEFPEDRTSTPFDSMYFIVDWESVDGPCLQVDDLKTGRYMPESFVQLMAGAWASLMAHPTEKYALATYTHWPRYPKGNPPTRSPAVHYTRSELMDWHNEVVIPARRLALGPGAETMTNPGAHCRWCRAKEHCPEWADGKIPCQI